MSEDDKKDGLKVVHIDVPPSEMKQAMIDYRRQLPDLIEYQKIQAELWFAKYKALTVQGFTPAEALTLCCK